MNEKKIARGPKNRLRLAVMVLAAAGFVAGAVAIGSPAQAWPGGTGCCIGQPN
ncbi:hypothetical protein [Actinoplanes sp. NPDC026670]|uniref:hypothetical protein n=1 Tax=Actinoplanes sp. NPDC026670 TaxID=3154700 RepID=UPI0033D71A1B